MKTTKIDKLYDVLRSGKNVPTTTLRRLLKTEHIGSVVRQARLKGATIYSNRIKDADGNTVSAYRLDQDGV